MASVPVEEANAFAQPTLPVVVLAPMTRPLALLANKALPSGVKRPSTSTMLSLSELLLGVESVISQIGLPVAR